jgi:predicted DNA-binding protein with PD1-like motif
MTDEPFSAEIARLPHPSGRDAAVGAGGGGADAQSRREDPGREGPPPGRHRGTRAGIGSFGRVLVIRLGPDEDVLPAMERLLLDADLTSGVILGGVASLRHASVRNIVRFPEQWPIQPDDRTRTTVPGPLEILALQGNVAPKPDGGLFIHCHVEFSTGSPAAVTYGGHLIEDTVVGTTCELYVAELRGLDVRRVHDPHTQTLELDVEPRVAGSRQPRR